MAQKISPKRPLFYILCGSRKGCRLLSSATARKCETSAKMTSHTSKVIVVDNKNAFGDETGPPIAPQLLGFGVCLCLCFSGWGLGSASLQFLSCLHNRFPQLSNFGNSDRLDKHKIPLILSGAPCNRNVRCARGAFICRTPRNVQGAPRPLAL